MRQITVHGVGSGAAVQLVSGDPDNPIPALLANSDPNNTIYLGKDQATNPVYSIETAPLAAGQNVAVDGTKDVYAICQSGQSVLCYVFDGVTSFFQLIVNSLGNLVIPGIQSPNFISLVQGWQILQNGNAQFNNVTITGTFNGTDFILNSHGLFMYSGTPAANNLILSVTLSGGTDANGNTYLSGFTTYTPGSGADVAVSLGAGGNTITWYSSTAGQTGWTQVGIMGFGAGSPGAIAIQNVLVGISGTGSGLLLNGQANPPATQSVGPILYSKSNTDAVHEVMPSGADRILDQTQSDDSLLSNSNSTTFQAMTLQYSIPSSDCAEGTVYELELWGNGTWESQTFTFGLAINGGTPVAQRTIGGAFAAAGHSVCWHVKYIIQLTSAPGVSSSIRVQCTGNISDVTSGTNALSSTTASIDGQANSVFNTTALNTVQIMGAFGANTLSEVMTSFGSRFTRKGT